MEGLSDEEVPALVPAKTAKVAPVKKEKKIAVEEDIEDDDDEDEEEDSEEDFVEQAFVEKMRRKFN